MAATKNLRLYCSRNVHQIHAAAARIRRSGSGWNRGLLAGPRRKDFVDGGQNRFGLEIADEKQHAIFRRVRFAVNGLQIGDFVCGDLRFGGGDFCVRMFAEQNFSQSFARKKSGLRAFEFYFFEFLPSLALELSLGK